MGNDGWYVWLLHAAFLDLLEFHSETLVLRQSTGQRYLSESPQQVQS